MAGLDYDYDYEEEDECTRDKRVNAAAGRA